MIEHEQPDGSVLVEDMRESRRVVIKVRVKSVEQRKHVEDALDEAPGD